MVSYFFPQSDFYKTNETAKTINEDKGMFNIEYSQHRLLTQNLCIVALSAIIII